jgi:VCBS repeat-containing protein
LSFNSNGSFVYTPDAGYVGLDSFSYLLSDGALTDTATISLEVTDTAPLAVDDSYTVHHGQTLTVSPVAGALANDSDADGDSLNAALDSAPQHGTLSFNSNGSFVYTPEAGYVGLDSFSYLLSDGALTDTATISLEVTDTAPIAVDDSYSGDEDSSITGNVLTNDGDPESDELTTRLVSGPAHGILKLDPGGTFSYTPDPDFNGSDSFTYRANDGQGDSNLALVNLTVRPVNDAPIAVDDTATTPEDTAVVLNLVANDSDVDSSTLSIVSLSAPLHGSAVLNADGTVTYTPDANYFGTDSFTYRSNDGQTDSANVATVSITITPVNDAPIAVDDTATTPEDTLVVLDLLANDSDADSSTLSVVSLSAPLHGSAVLNADGTVSYTPDANYFGTDSFTYRTNDGQTDSANVATVSITITPLNDAPIAIDDTATTPEDTAVVLNLVANDSDVDSSTLSIVSLSAPLHGSAVLNADGTVTYTPDANYFGTDSFTYRTNDGQADSANVATVSITITPVNDAPIAVDDTATTPEDTAVVLITPVNDAPIAVDDLVANDSDVDSSTLSVVSLSAPLHGSAVLNADGTVSYTPDANYFGTDSFTYRSNDGQTDSANVATVSITITPVNDAPIAVDDTATTPEDTAVVLNLVANDSDVDSSTLSVVSLSAPLHGSAVLNADGTVTYTPDANYFGTDSFTYRITINDGQPSTTPRPHRKIHWFSTSCQRRDTLSACTITPVNDAPIANGRRHRDHTGRHRGRTEPGSQRQRRRQQHAVDRLPERAAARQRGAERRRHLHVTYTPDANYFGTDSFTYRTTAATTARHRQLHLPHERRPGRFSQRRDGQHHDHAGQPIRRHRDHTGRHRGCSQRRDGQHHDHAGQRRADRDVDDTATTPEDTAGRTEPGGQRQRRRQQHAVGRLPERAAARQRGAERRRHGELHAGCELLRPDSFTYRTNDGQADSANVATVSITITPVNDAPIAVDDTATTPEDTAVVLNLVANDSDVDSSTLSVVSLSAPLHGSAVLNADGTVTYTPDANYFGTDTFTYRINDGLLDSENTGIVTVVVGPVNNPPVAVDDTATTPEDTAVVLNLVANDSDVDSSTLSVVSLSAPLHGSAVLNADGTVTYTPDANYFGTDSFTYRTNDGQADSANVATVSISITPVNDAPIAVDDTATTPEDTAVVLNLVANDSDVDSSTLSVVSLSAPLHGSAVLNADGTVSYTPDANYFGHRQLHLPHERWPG